MHTSSLAELLRLLNDLPWATASEVASEAAVPPGCVVVVSAVGLTLLLSAAFELDVGGGDGGGCVCGGGDGGIDGGGGGGGVLAFCGGVWYPVTLLRSGFWLAPDLSLIIL